MRNDMLICTILIVFVMIGSIRFIEDNDYAKDEIILHANVKALPNNDFKLKYIIMDDGDVRATSHASGSNSVASRTMYSKLDENIKPGEYWFRFYVYGDNGERRIKHRPIYIG